jgi:hypothetical protein
MKNIILFLVLIVFASSSQHHQSTKTTHPKKTSHPSHSSHHSQYSRHSTKNCQVDDPSIQRKARSLKGKTEEETARNIFKYVQTQIRYERYANSKKGAAKTLLTRKGNCCDQAHLLVALWRAAGINARYAHGTDHWWGQCIINGKAYDCDPTNQKHEFGRPHHSSKDLHPQYYEELDH